MRAPAALSQSLRGLRRQRGLVSSVVLCLALGLGANLMMLGVVDLLLFRSPAHVSDAEELRRLYFVQQRHGRGESASPAHVYPLLESLVAANEDSAGSSGGTGIEDLAAFCRAQVPLGRGAEARTVPATFVSGQYFELLGTSAQRGRTFTAEEAAADTNPHRVLISQELYERQLRQGTEVLGSELSLDGRSYTVIGVMPRGFTGLDLEAVDLWLPLGAVEHLLYGEGWEEDQTHYFLYFAGRLKEGVSPEVAEARLTSQYRQITGWEDQRVDLEPLQAARGPKGSPNTRIALLLTGLSAVILLIACANVSQLLIVHNLRRRRELAVRLGLGGNRAALLRLILLDSGVLAVLGALGALAVLFPLHRLLGALLLPPDVAAQPLDLRLLGGLAVLCAAVCFLCSLAPGVWLIREDLLEHLKGGSQGTGHREARLRTALLVAQVALTLLLLVGAGLFVQSLLRVTRLDLGLDADRVLVVDLDLARHGYKPEEIDATYRRAREAVNRTGLAEAAAVTNAVPFRSTAVLGLEIPGLPELPTASSGSPTINAVEGPYLATLGASLVEGRAFSAEERAGRGEPVALVGESMARLFWPQDGALGQCLRFAGTDGPCYTVVGVVEDVRRMRLQEDPALQYYIPLASAPEHLHASRYLLVRTKGHAAARIADIRRQLRALVPDLPFFHIDPLEERVVRQHRPWRLGAWLFSVFGGLALVLALLGLIAGVSESVHRRRRELGIRLALGADRDQLSRWVVMRSLRWPLLGVLLGVVAAVLVGPLIQPFLFQVSPLNPWVLLGVTLTFVLVAALASSLPARRLRRIEPGQVLGGE